MWGVCASVSAASLSSQVVYECCRVSSRYDGVGASSINLVLGHFIKIDRIQLVGGSFLSIIASKQVIGWDLL